jgi:hypothetical protein
MDKKQKNLIRDRKYFQRNVAIAIGHVGDPAFIPALLQVMNDPEELVRASTVWAAGKIGGPKSRQILEASLYSETAESGIVFTWFNYCVLLILRWRAFSQRLSPVCEFQPV